MAFILRTVDLNSAKNENILNSTIDLFDTQCQQIRSEGLNDIGESYLHFMTAKE